MKAFSLLSYFFLALVVQAEASLFGGILNGVTQVIQGGTCLIFKINCKPSGSNPSPQPQPTDEWECDDDEEAPQPTAPQPTSAPAPKPTTAAPQPSSGPQPTSNGPQPTSNGPQPTSNGPQPTSGPQPSESLDCDEDEATPTGGAGENQNQGGSSGNWWDGIVDTISGWFKGKRDLEEMPSMVVSPELYARANGAVGVRAAAGAVAVAGVALLI
ncbi:hypothetical protein DICA1_E30900 [Diutina catenulata]